MSEEIVREMTVEELIEQNKTYLGFIESRYKEMQKRCEKLNDRCGYIELNSYGEGIKKGEQLMQEKVNKMLEFREHTKWEIIQDIFGTKTALVDFVSNINESYNEIIEYKQNNNRQGLIWIPCSDRLPKKEQECLVCRNGIIRIDKFIGRDIPYKWDLTISDYDAWMPLPKPYKGKEV